MLVIISDLHLTDGTSGETIKTGAFRTFRERIRDLAYDASWRSDEKYAPIECVDLVLLGDVPRVGAKRLPASATGETIPVPVSLTSLPASRKMLLKTTRRLWMS
jgi:hypothetical protein